jgi:hypothetical protein
VSQPLGHVPIKSKLTLSKGADFAQIVRRQASDPIIPIGTTADIVLYTKGTETVLDTWTAISVTEDYAEFRVEAEDADLIPAGANFRLYIHYPETPTLDLLWVYGDVQRKQ